MIKTKHIEAAREVRLWIGQVLVPATVGGLILISNPNVRMWAKEKIDAIKAKRNN